MICLYISGEDRWLCTLLLQQGYRVDYSAAADALTYCPESFEEFFKQRRRWVPSTLANIWDLLSDFSNTVLINDNISQLFMIYQAFIMVSTVLGPATIIITIASAFQAVLGLDNYLWVAYTLSLLIPAIYLGICFIFEEKTQLLVAGMFSMIYAAIMTIVLVGLVINMAVTDVLNPSLFFLVFLVASFIFAGFLHPYEMFCLLHGILYFVCIPTGYILLMIYSLSNMHVISWGTREVPQRKSQKQQAADEAEAAPKSDKKTIGFVAYIRKIVEGSLFEVRKTISDVFQATKQDRSANEKMVKTLRQIHKELKRLNRRQAAPSDSSSSSDSEDEAATVIPGAVQVVEAPKPLEVPAEREAPPPEQTYNLDAVVECDPDNPKWIQDPGLGDGGVGIINERERAFWNSLIKRYLKPLKTDKRQKEKLEGDLIALRNNVSFGFWMVNAIWVLLNFMLQTHISPINLYQKDDGTWIQCQPHGFVFIVFYLIVLGLQILGMLMHR